MRRDWPRMKLREVLRLDVDRVPVDAAASYPMVGVLSFGRGLFEREPVKNGNTSYRVFYRLNSQHIVMSQLFGWEGALALSSEQFAGKFLSPQFPTFTCDVERLHRSFLGWFMQRRLFWEDLASRTSGMGDRRRTLNPDALLACEIPLPPIDEQQRIVSKIEAIAAKIYEGRTLREEASRLSSQLMSSKEMSIWPRLSEVKRLNLGEVTTFLGRGRQSEQGISNHILIKTQHVQMGRYVESNLTLAPHSAAKVGSEAMVRSGDILIACSAAGCLGRVAVCGRKYTKASTDTHVAIARADLEHVLPEYLYAYLKGAEGQFQLRSREKGDWRREKISFRLTELNMNDLRQVPVPVPSLSEQAAIVSYLNKLEESVDTLKSHQQQTSVELDAFMSSILDKAFKGKL